MPPSDNYHLFPVDGSFQEHLTGRTLQELRPWFPDLVPAGQGSALQRKDATGGKLKPDEFLWFGDIREGIELKDGRYQRLVHYDKG